MVGAIEGKHGEGVIFMLDCEKYNPGEEATKLYLQQNGYTVIDTSKDPEQRELYDFIAIKGQEQTTFEAKYDTYLHYSGQIVYETNHRFLKSAKGWEHTAGWGYKTKANYLSYYDPIGEVLYILDMTELKDSVWNTNLPQKSTRKDGYKQTFFYLIDLKDYQEQGNQVKKVSIKLPKQTL